MTNEVERTLSKLNIRTPADPAIVGRLANTAGVSLPSEYLAFMARSDAGDGDLGRTWIEIWPADRVLGELGSEPQHYEGVVLFAGDGANTVYGFDRCRDAEVVEGDWIGLNRDELIPRGTFADFVTGLAATRE